MVARPPAQSGKTAGAGNYHTRYRARPRDALEAAGADDLSPVMALQDGLLGLATGVGERVDQARWGGRPQELSECSVTE